MGSGAWDEIFSDSNVLCLWSAHEVTEMDIAPGIPQLLNIAAASDQLHSIQLSPEVKPIVHRLREAMQERGVFRFDVRITGDGISEPCRFSVTLDGTVKDTAQLSPILS